MKHKPACILDVRVPSGSFDVNLTPDKREIVLTHGSFMFEVLYFLMLFFHFYLCCHFTYFTLMNSIVRNAK